MDLSEDLSARVLLKHILITETPRTPVSRSDCQEPCSSGTRRSSRLRRKDAEAQTPQHILRRSLQHKMRESITRKSLPAPKGRTSSGVLRKSSAPAAASMPFNDGETPRHLLMNILQTEPVKSPVVHEKGASEEPEAPLADNTVTVSRPSIELSGLDLPDVTFVSVASTAKVLSRKRPHRSLNVTAFEKRLKDGDDAEEEIESSVADHSSLSLSSSTSLSLKTPFADVRTEKKGLQRRVSNRRKITEEEFGAAVSRREMGGVSSFALVERDLSETTHCEGFTLGLTKLGEPDTTADIMNCNTALYDQAHAMTSNLSIFATQDKPTVMASQLQKEMQEMELDGVGDQFMSGFLNEVVVVTEAQNNESLSGAELQEDADEAEPQNLDGLCPHEASAFLSKSEEDEDAAQSHISNMDNKVEAEEIEVEEDGAVDFHREDKVDACYQLEEEEVALDSQTAGEEGTAEEEEGAAESQTEEEEGAAESQTEEEEGAAESQTEEEEGAAESQTEEEEGAAESQTEEEEGAAESQMEEEEGAAESQTEEKEGAAESQMEEEEGAAESQMEEEEGAAASQTEEEGAAESQTEEEEETAESQTEVDAAEPQCEDVEAGSQTEEESMLGSQTDEDEEQDGGAKSQTEENATDPQSKEAGSQSEEDEDVTESQTKDEPNWKGDRKGERQESEHLECDLKRISQRAHSSEGPLIMPVTEMGDDLVETTTARWSDAKSRTHSDVDLDASVDMGSQKISQEYTDGADLQDGRSYVEHKPEAGKETFHLLGVTQDIEVSGHLGDPPPEEAPAQDDDEQEGWEDADDGEESEEFPSKTPAFVREKRNFFQHDHLASPSVVRNIQASGATEALPAAKPKKVRQRKTGPTKKENVLPKTYLMSVFKHFAKMKVSADVYPVLNEIMDKFLDRLAEDLEMYAAHAKRKTIDFEDAVLLLKRQGYVNDKVPVEVLIEKYLRMEQRKILIPIATSGNVVIPKRRR